MIRQLRKIFSTLVLYQDLTEEQPEAYQWFLTADNELVGIHQQELTAKDSQLLNTFLRPHSIVAPKMTTEEKAWQYLITGGNTSDTTSIPYRFIYFSFQRDQIDPHTFKEAVNEFFLKQVPVLWENDHEGIIIEENLNESISYEAIIDVLMSDLSVNIHFFVGPFINSFPEAKNAYQSLTKGAAVVRKYSDKAVVTYIEAIPYMLIDLVDDDTRSDIIQFALARTINDRDLLHTVKTFIACNLNVSVTAKELFMHRNSLQYRLDKFSEKTGIDIRDFRQASAVYLALLANV
ncbi:PucR family transcriptional regulator [Lentibacillus salinarum]|uniref:Helix-turn-helix domain-containing protein n=1 Tax=Lentibacillus salinarum TaxID=446820 RepID=A0ABW3ZRT7_9BACI